MITLLKNIYPWKVSSYQNQSVDTDVFMATEDEGPVPVYAQQTSEYQQNSSLNATKILNWLSHTKMKRNQIFFSA